MRDFYQKIDILSKKHVEDYANTKQVTNNIVDVIIYLYEQIESEKEYNNQKFESAYQMSITPLFEFYIARFFFHLSEKMNYGWSLYLRRQVNKCAPDVRIAIGDRTLAIIEVKIKGGWIQPFFSKERFENDDKRKNDKKSNFDPQELIDKQNIQLKKYEINFKDSLVFMLLPTFNMIHRNKYKANYADYKVNFKNNTNKDEDFLVVLSKNLTLNLAQTDKIDKIDKMLTNEFEVMINKIVGCI